MAVGAPRSRLPQVGTTIFTVMSQLAQEHGAVNLSQGFPDFSPPGELIERLAFHLRQGANQYPPMAGVAALREAIAEKVARLYAVELDPGSEVTVTAGATEALFSAVTALVHAGDEVIVFAPVYDAYVPAIELAGATVRYARLRYPDFRPDWDEVRALLGPRTRAIMLNTPHNPTGTVWTAGDMRQLEALLAGTDTLVISDEVYEHMVFADAPSAGRHESVLRYPGLAERSVVVSSFGKTYHITGWKIAYALAPRALTAELRKVHQFVVFTVHHASQLAIADFMRSDPGFADGLAAFYQGKRDCFRARMADTGFDLLPSHGTYFQLARYPRISGLPDVEFSRWLTQQHGVATIPVSVFSPAEPNDGPPLVRFCFAKGDATLEAAAERLRRIPSGFVP